MGWGQRASLSGFALDTWKVGYTRMDHGRWSFLVFCWFRPLLGLSGVNFAFVAAASSVSSLGSGSDPDCYPG